GRGQRDPLRRGGARAVELALRDAEAGVGELADRADVGDADGAPVEVFAREHVDEVAGGRGLAGVGETLVVVVRQLAERVAGFGERVRVVVHRPRTLERD